MPAPRPPPSLPPPQDEGHCSFVAERAELLLRQAAQYGLRTRAACVEYLGRLFRATLDAPAHKTDYQVGAGSPSWGWAGGGCGRPRAASWRWSSEAGTPALHLRMTRLLAAPRSCPCPDRKSVV